MLQANFTKQTQILFEHCDPIKRKNHNSNRQLILTNHGQGPTKVSDEFGNLEILSASIVHRTPLNMRLFDISLDRFFFHSQELSQWRSHKSDFVNFSTRHMPTLHFSTFDQFSEFPEHDRHITIPVPTYHLSCQSTTFPDKSHFLLFQSIPSRLSLQRSFETASPFFSNI
jgi:hypothetical protein